MTTPASNPPAPGRGILFILSGPSGVGKDTVLHKALPRMQGIRTSVSVTTRAPRPGEREGIDYFYITRDEFVHLRDSGQLLEHAEVHGNCYGTPATWVEEQRRAGTDVMLSIDVQGALAVKRLVPDAILIFLAPPSWGELERRLRARNTEDEATIRRRLHNARAELARVDQYEYLVVNDRLSEAVCKLIAVITAERCRSERQDLHLLQEESLDG